MSRPAARKSTLGRAHPAAPRSAEPEPDAEAPSQEQSPKPPARTRGPKSPARTKVTFYTTEEQAGQARAVLANVPSAQHGYRNLSEFIDAAVAEKVQAMQNTYNGGKPWPAAEAGTVARGRPVE